MQTLRRTRTVKYTVNIPENMGEPKDVNYSLTNTLLVLFKLLEQKGLKYSPQMGAKITPEVLEKLLLGKDQKEKKTHIFAKNKTANAILSRIEQTGGLHGKGEEIRKLGQGFREDFEFKHDRKL